MQKTLLNLMRANNVSITDITIIENGDVQYSDTISLLPTTKMPTRTIFQACSFSKVLTALAISLLAEKGKIDLDTPINDQLMSWKIPTTLPITPRHCLNMTSGLQYSDNTAPIIYKQNEPLPSLKDILTGTPPAKNKAITTSTFPGISYQYSGAGYMVLQQLIEDVTQISFSAYIKKIIFDPLNMKDSTFNQDPINGNANLAPGFNKHGTKLPNGFYPNPYLASGGLWSTANDISKLIIAISHAYTGKDNSVISQLTAKSVLTPQKETPFGLGVILDAYDNPAFNFRKNGQNAGYHCELLMFPHSDQGIVIMTNKQTGITVIEAIIEAIAQANNWPIHDKNFDELKIPQSKPFSKL